MRPGLLSPDSHQIQIVKIMRDHVVHGFIFALSADLVAVQNVHGGSEAGNSLGQGVVLARLPVTEEDVVRRGDVLLHRRHPSPYRCLKRQGRVVFYVLRVVQKVHLQGLAGFSIVVVPVMSGQVNKQKKKDCCVQIGL